MVVPPYYSTFTGNIASDKEVVDKTSSQIFLSRGVAGADSEPPSPHPTSPPLIASIYESESAQIMTVGDAATRTTSLGPNGVSNSSSVDETEVSRLAAPAIKEASVPSQSHKSPNCSCESASESNSEIRSQNAAQNKNKSRSGKGKEADRGRSIEQGPKYPNPLSRAESWSRRKDVAIEIDVRPIEKRNISRSSTFFEDPGDPCGALDDHLLEPCPNDSICDSMSEVLSAARQEKDGMFRLHRSSTWSSNYHSRAPSAQQPARALTTAFNECRPLFPEPILLFDTLLQSRPNISRLESLADETSFAVDTSPITPLSVSSLSSKNIPFSASTFRVQLPTEILQQIYYNLSPADFNAARHTCRSWYINSLNGKLLEIMLQRGGISSSCLTGEPAQISYGSNYSASREWIMSKRISRECALGPDWTGNGICNDEADPINATSTKSSFVQVSCADFTELAVHYPGPGSAGTLFTVSSCGRFLMAANGCLVYVYELNHRRSGSVEMSPGNLRPITSIICPRRVIASSMDTSSHRYAIAILMEGRMGLVCDISALNPSLTQPDQHSKSSGQCRVRHQAGFQPPSTSFFDRVSLNNSSSTAGAGRPLSQPPFVFPGIAAPRPEVTSVEENCWQDIFSEDISESSQTAALSSCYAPLPRSYIVDSEGPPINDFSEERLGISNASMPIETGPRSLYRHLCSDDDPPRSVAICPQRRCVAFGCSSGIELHWVDALTGQDLNRWFPLTAPSDFLYFLPPRKSVDSAKKLRLISSSSKPGERPAIADRSFGGRTRSSPFWERMEMEHINDGDDLDARGILTRLRGDARRTVLTGRIDTSDHYKAVPLSDGYHILFTDPSTGFLCLGSDAPVGGPTKLLRKIWFQGPEGIGSPIHYTVGSDLSLGVRVVAAFGSGVQQSILLFSVPSDIFAANQSSQSVYPLSTWSNPSLNQEIKCNDWLNWWPDDGLQEWLSHAHDPVPGVLPRNVWPIKIRGQMISSFNGLVDLAIDAGPHMTIWAFSRTGLSVVWKLNDGSFDRVKKSLIMRDGTVREEDVEGNIEMLDLPPKTPGERLQDSLLLQSESFDGTASSMLTSHICVPQTERRCYVECNDMSVLYDADGDVLMQDFPTYRTIRAQEGQSWEELALEQYGGEMWNQRKEWLRRNYQGPTIDFIKELTGLVRIDVEIQ